MINNQKYLLILCFFSGTRSDVASSFQILATSPPTNPPCPTSTCKNKILNLQICKSPCNSKIYILIFTKPWIYVFSSGTFSTPPLMPRQNAMQRLQTLNVTTSFVREWWDLIGFDLKWGDFIIISSGTRVARVWCSPLQAWTKNALLMGFLLGTIYASNHHHCHHHTHKTQNAENNIPSFRHIHKKEI